MGIEIPNININGVRKEIDEKNAEMEKREQEKIKEDYERLSKQEKPTEKPIEGKPVEEKKEESEEKKKPSTAKTMEGKEEEPKEKKGEKEKKKENLEKEITENFNDELKKIKSMPDKTGGFNKTAELKMKKTEKYFQLIESWQDLAYLDNYKGIKNIFSELDELKPSIFFYNLKKARITNSIAKSMALNYKEWKIEDKEKLKIIKNFVKEQSKEKNIFYSKDKNLKEIAQILASKNMPYKNNIDAIVKEIENPDIKSETIARMADIEKESIEKKKQSLQRLKEDMKSDKLPPDEIIIEQLKELGIDPKAASEIFSEASEILKIPEVQKKIQELRNIIEKTTKAEKGKEIPDAVKEVKDYIKDEKKGSPWKTGFEAIGGAITFSLFLFILLVLKGIGYFPGMAENKKKKIG